MVGLGGSNITFRINGDVQMVSLISKEQRDTYGSTWSIVVSELHKRLEFRPVVLMVITIYMEVLLEGLICIFSLSIIFRVIT